jgi:NhaP-type Na+/H+ or K+/H+ antiporter
MDIINLSSPDTYDVILFYIGFIILIATFFPRFLSNYLITAPIVYLLLAVGVFYIFFSESPLSDIAESPYLGKRLTELGVIISLTAAGLKIKEPFSWKTWRYASRLLLFTMPLTIALVALFGWGFLGFAPATAMLLGAVIAPTDPVLASDIQTTPPLEDDSYSARLALTTEAGLNDGLAFPFTNMAIAMALVGVHPDLWFADWLIKDFFYKIIAGTIIGFGTGWLLAKIIFSCPDPNTQSSKLSVGLLSLSLTLFPYGLAELIHSYGFIAVFVAASTFRHQETTNEYLNVLHDFSEEMESVLVAILFTYIGIYLSQSFTNDFQWYMIPAAMLIVLFIRPLTGYVSLIGTELPEKKKLIISFYGIRGIGSVYYLLYAFYHANFEGAREALALVMVVILLSVVVHGLSARTVMKKWAPY